MAALISATAYWPGFALAAIIACCSALIVPVPVRTAVPAGAAEAGSGTAEAEAGASRTTPA
jgi:hypothetical protein